VHHHTIQKINQLDATISPVFYLTLIHSSTCFGRPHAHHQELNNCSSSLWFYLRSVVIGFIIPKLIEGSTCFERHTAHHQELQIVFVACGLYSHVVTGRCPGWVGSGSGISTVSSDQVLTWSILTVEIPDPLPTQPGQRRVTTWVYKPQAANIVWSSWWWAVCHSKHVEPSINFGIINSITRLHLVGYFYWFILRWTEPWILTL
jgi:hypothetical protein